MKGLALAALALMATRVGTAARRLRFYNPTAANFDRSWPLADFEEIKP
jgi:hypothetical protein